MFKEGNIIVCIDDSNDTKTFEPYKNLKKYSTYKIENYSDYYMHKYIKLINIGGNFRVSRFISLKEYRKLKLEKLCLNQEIK